MFIWIYSYIRSCHFLDTNIFGYSFVSKSIQMSHSALDGRFVCFFTDNFMQCKKEHRTCIYLSLIKENRRGLVNLWKMKVKKRMEKRCERKVEAGVIVTQAGASLLGTGCGSQHSAHSASFTFAAEKLIWWWSVITLCSGPICTIDDDKKSPDLPKRMNFQKSFRGGGGIC